MGSAGKMKTMTVSLPLGLLVAACFLMAPPGCRQQENTYAPPPPPVVTVSQPVKKKVTSWAEFTGTTEAFEYVEIRARVEGFLESIHFEASAYVRKGDLLYIIDPRPYQAKVNQAEADLEVRRAGLKLAEATLARKESAFKENAVSEVEVIDARAKRDQARASIEAAQAALETARLDLSYTQVVAPIHGRVGRTLVDEGNLVGAGEATLLTTIVNDDPVYAYFNVSERDLIEYRKLEREMEAKGVQKLDPGPQHVYLGLYNESGFPHTGVVDFIENRMDPETGTIQVRAVFPNPEHFLLAGLFARIRLPLGAPKESLLVPEAALGADQRGRYLLVVNDQEEVEYRSVVVGQSEGSMCVIQSGIEEGDRVVVKGLQRARPGIKVNPQTVKSGDGKAPGGQQES